MRPRHLLAAALTTWFCLCTTVPSQSEETSSKANLHERSRLFGDWRGAKTALAQRGILLDFSSTHFYQGVTSGGRKADRGEWEYGGYGDAQLTIVGDKFRLPGFSAVIHAETKFGEDINNAVGLAPPNVRMLVPLFDAPGISVTGWQLNQMIRNEWLLSAGKFDIMDLVDQTYHTGKGEDKMWNASLVLPLNFGRPLSGLSLTGAGITKLRGREVEGGLFVFDTKDRTTTFGIDDTLFNEGATLLGLWKIFYDIGGLPGYSGVLASYNTRKFNSVDPGTFYILPGQGAVFPEVEGSWAVSYTVDQKLWMDPADASRNIGMFAWVGAADDNPNPINWSGAISFEANGLIPGRQLDSFGIGYFYTGLSSNFQDLISALPGPLAVRDLQGFEAYYKFGLTKWLDVTADLQVLRPSQVGVDTAVIAGARTKIRF
jgi:porin